MPVHGLGDVKTHGISGGVDQQIILSETDLTAGCTSVDSTIISNLFAKGKLITD
jgi:hypothetical protein